MSKILSIKDYVISETTKLYQNPDRNCEDFKNHAESLLNHVTLLNQSLRLGHFVPTSKNDQQFTEFQLDSINSEDEGYSNLRNAYKEALKEVIFQNWHVINIFESTTRIRYGSTTMTLTWDHQKHRFTDYEFMTIEDMVLYELETNLNF